MADVGKKKARGVEGSGLPVKIMCPDKTLFDGVAESVIIKSMLQTAGLRRQNQAAGAGYCGF